MFVRAAKGFCQGPCKGNLSDEERRAQQGICSKCAGARESNLRDYGSMDRDTSGVKRSLHDANMQYQSRISHQLVTLGRCKNPECGGEMQLSGSLVPGSQLAGERYVYCPECRTSLVMRFLKTPAEANETTTAPVTEGVIWQNRLVQSSPPIQTQFPTVGAQPGCDEPSVTLPPLLNTAHSQEESLGSGSSRPWQYEDSVLDPRSTDPSVLSAQGLLYRPYSPGQQSFQIYDDGEDNKVIKDDKTELMKVSDIADPAMLDPDFADGDDMRNASADLNVSTEIQDAPSPLTFNDPESKENDENACTSAFGGRFPLSEFALEAHAAQVRDADAATARENTSPSAYASPSAYIVATVGESNQADEAQSE